MLRALLLCLMLTLTSVCWGQDDWTIEDFMAETGVREGPVPSRDLPGWRPDPTILLRTDPGDAESLAREFPDARFIVAGVENADVIVGSCDADAVRAAENLVWVQIFSAGAERCLAVEEIRSGRVLLTNMQKMSSPAIGEHAVAMALSLARGLVRYGKVMPEGKWRRELNRNPDMFSVSGKTMLVVGLGGIGTAVAKRASALGMRVIATRNSSREGPAFVDHVGLSDELPELLGQADIIVNALPLTAATTGLFSKALFAEGKPGAYFINVGRGGTVQTDALVEALRSGHLAGAGLDVTDPEPLPPDHPLWQMSNVIITPHVSWAGADRRLHNMLLRENIRRYLAGDALLNVVDPGRGY